MRTNITAICNVVFIINIITRFINNCFHLKYFNFIMDNGYIIGVWRINNISKLVLKWPLLNVLRCENNC